ncbi:MAG: flagellar basal body P-ring protein FlgI [Rhodospirillaceae bacterium]
MRLKDIVDIEGIRDNPLVGYGLVVGLNGTGDNRSPIQSATARNMLERMGLNLKGVNIDPPNTAAVMVTATLPPFAGQGTRIDVSVASLVNAKSLLGGVLLVTPLVAADGEVYAVAQGSVSIAGYSATGKSEGNVTVGVPTSGRIAAGAVVEREIAFALAELPIIRLSLRNPDFTTARRIAQAINRELKQNVTQVADPSTVLVNIPKERYGENIELLTDIENILIEPDLRAKVVIDERTGAIVMGENVRISTVAVSLGTLTVRITETPQVSQPNSFTGNANAAITSNSNNTGTNVNNAGGVSTVTVQRSDIQADTSGDRRLAVMPSGISLGEVVQNLNALGVGPRDMITLLQAIKAAGAMQAEISGM